MESHRKLCLLCAQSIICRIRTGPGTVPVLAAGQIPHQRCLSLPKVHPPCLSSSWVFLNRKKKIWWLFFSLGSWDGAGPEETATLQVARIDHYHQFNSLLSHSFGSCLAQCFFLFFTCFITSVSCCRRTLWVQKKRCGGLCCCAWAEALLTRILVTSWHHRALPGKRNNKLNLVFWFYTFCTVATVLLRINKCSLCVGIEYLL